MLHKHSQLTILLWAGPLYIIKPVGCSILASHVQKSVWLSVLQICHCLALTGMRLAGRGCTKCCPFSNICLWLQVGVKTQYQGSQGQITFFLGNKHDAALERLIFAVPPQPQFQLQLAPVPQRIDSKQQVQVCCPAVLCSNGILMLINRDTYMYPGDSKWQAGI